MFTVGQTLFFVTLYSCRKIPLTISEVGSKNLRFAEANFKGLVLSVATFQCHGGVFFLNEADYCTVAGDLEVGSLAWRTLLCDFARERASRLQAVGVTSVSSLLARDVALSLYGCGDFDVKQYLHQNRVHEHGLLQAAWAEFYSCVTSKNFALLTCLSEETLRSLYTLAGLSFKDAALSVAGLRESNVSILQVSPPQLLRSFHHAAVARFPIGSSLLYDSAWDFSRVPATVSRVGYKYLYLDGFSSTSMVVDISSLSLRSYTGGHLLGCCFKDDCDYSEVLHDILLIRQLRSALLYMPQLWSMRVITALLNADNVSFIWPRKYLDGYFSCRQYLQNVEQGYALRLRVLYEWFCAFVPAACPDGLCASDRYTLESITRSFSSNLPISFIFG